MLFDTRLPQPGHVAIAQANTHGAPFPSDECKETPSQGETVVFFWPDTLGIQNQPALGKGFGG
jgi:hypothetical protein